MLTKIARCGAGLLCLLLGSAYAAAEPVKLKFSFFTSDRSIIYLGAIKPFVDAVNEEGRGIVQIDMYFSGAISSVQAEQPRLVSEGTADIALIVPDRTPDRFPGTGVLELPGLFRDSREASEIYARLVSNGALPGYRDYFVVSTYVSGPEYIHSRKPINSLADLEGLKIRATNQMAATVLERLGAIPVLLAINNSTTALTSAAIDGAVFSPTAASEFGFSRVASNHYMVAFGGVPSAVIMNRKKFESLPATARAIIQKYSGSWPAKQNINLRDARDKEAIDDLKADARRKVVYPSAKDEKMIQAAFKAATADWIESGENNRALLDTVTQEIAKLRGSN